jgi:protein-S-isoprenylcysteine O-methyltransferase Ste14
MLIKIERSEIILFQGLTGEFILLCWAIFAIVWFVTAFFAKRTVESSGWAWRFAVGGVILVWLLLARYGGVLIPILDRPVWLQSLPIQITADVIVFLGLLITLWARLTLGGNWSANVTFKENHELIERGPYQFVRHPIYSGILLMVLGLMIWFGVWGGFLAFVLIFIGLWFKARQEEKLLTKHFPQEYPQYKSRVKALIPFAL